MSSRLLHRAVEKLAAMPTVFDGLRWILEGGYTGHRKLIGRHLACVTGRVLDIGCGTGIFAAHFPPDQYTGIDVSSIYTAASSRKHPRHSFVTMDARNLAFETDSFDAAYISGVLHHLSDSDARAVIGEAARVLKPTGQLIVWEDIAAPWWNLVGHLIHALDLGSNIRTVDGYTAILSSAVSVIRAYRMRSGFMDYAVYVCSPVKHEAQAPVVSRVPSGPGVEPE